MTSLQFHYSTQFVVDLMMRSHTLLAMFDGPLRSLGMVHDDVTTKFSFSTVLIF